MTIAALRESVIKAGLDASGYEAGARKVHAANQNMVASGDKVVQTQEKLTRTTAGGASAIERLSRELDRSYAAQQRFERAQRQIDSAMGRGLISQQRGAELLALAQQRYLGVAAGAEQAAAGAGRFGAAAAAATSALGGMSGSLGAVGSGLSAMGTAGAVAAAAAAGIVTAVAGIATAGDRATATLARLTAATGSIDAARAAYEGLYQVSLRTGVSVADAAGTFQRFRIAAGEIGATNAQVLQLVEGLQKAAVVSGTAGHEGAAAMMQLGQALASGRLNGDELRSLLENMPSLAQRLAEELGTNIGQLRKLGEEGQLTADRVFPALLRATDRMAADFDKMPLTMSRAFDILGNSMRNFVEKLDEALGLSNLIAKAAKAAADAVNGVRRTVLPTEQEALQGSIAEARARIAQNTSRLFNDQPGANISRFDLARRQQQDAERRSWIAADESLIRSANDRLAEIEKEGQQQRFGEFVTAQQKRAASERTAAEARAKEREAELFKDVKLQQEHAKRLKEIDEDLARGGLTSDQAARQRTEATRQYNEDLKKLRDEQNREGDKATKKAEREAEKEAKARDKVLDKLRVEQAARERMAVAQGQGEAAVAELNRQLEYETALREAGIPVIGRRTEEEERAARAIWETVAATDAATKAEKSIVEAREASKRELERINRDIESQARRVSDDVATNLYEGLVEGRRQQTVLATFGNLFKRIAIQAASTQIFLPITTAVIGAVPGLFGIGSGGTAGTAGGSLLSGASDLLGLGQLLGGRSIGDALGLTGAGGILNATAITGWGTSTNAALGAMGGAYGPATEAAVMAQGGGGLFGGAGATFGQLLGGVGAGFTAGTLLNTLLGGKQTGGMVGSGVGALAGAAIGSIIPGIGTLLGGLIGGAAGGGLGGLFGPGESVRGYGYRLEAADDGLLRMGAANYNPEGEAAFREATAGIDALNAWMGQRGITIGGAASVGGNRNGPDLSNATAGSFREGVSQLYYHSSDPTLQAALSARGNRFGDVAEMQKFVEGFQAVQATIEALTAKPVPQFTAQMNAIGATFDTAIAQAREYGLAEEALSAARAKAVADLEAERAEYFRQVGVSLEVRRLRAQGRTQESELAQQAEEARQQLAAAAADLDRWAASAAEKTRYLAELEEVQAAERAEIIARYGEQAAEALRQAGGNIRAWLDNLASGAAGGLSPTDRLAAAQQTFNRDRVLAMGGDRDALGRITGSADALLGAGRDMFASGGGFQAIRNEIVGALGALPVVQSYDAMQTAALEAIQQHLEMGTLITAISPAMNGVTIMGGLSLATLEQAIAQLHASSLAVGDAINRQINSGTQTALDVGRALNQVLVGQTAAIVEAGAALNRAANSGTAATLDVGAALQRTLVQQGAVTTEGLAEISAWLGGLGNYAAIMSLDLHMLRAAADAAAQIAVDASAANVKGLGGLSRIAIDASAAQVAAQNAGNTVAADVGAALGAHLSGLRGQVVMHALSSAARMDAANRIAADAAAADVAGFAAMNRILVDSAAAATTGTALTNSLLAGLQAGAANDNLLPALQGLDAHLAGLRGQFVMYSLSSASRLDAANRIAEVAAANDVAGFAAMNRILVDSAAAATTGTAIGNSHLAAILAETRAGTAHGLVTAGQIQVVANRAHSAVLHIATHQQYTLQGNARLVDINTSLGTVDRSARDINTSLATVHAAIAAGNRIAADAAAATATSFAAANTIAVDAASASTASFAAANTIAVDSNAALVTALASLATQLAAANQRLASLEAKMDASNTIAATGHQIVATTTRDTLAITNGELARINTNLRGLAA
jgi:tape measure domain-containing protein